MPTGKKFYAYFLPASGESGVMDNWPATEKKVSGKVGARYKSFESQEEAEGWLARGAVYESVGVRRVAIKLEKGIYFDAGTGRGEGVEVSVTDENGRNLLDKVIPKNELNKFGKLPLGNRGATNNYGELLAMKYALEIAKKSRSKKIFGDSKLVIEYWSQWKIKKKEVAPETAALAGEVSGIREVFEKKGGVVNRISGDNNPADLGFH